MDILPAYLAIGLWLAIMTGCRISGVKPRHFPLICIAWPMALFWPFLWQAYKMKTGRM